MEQFDSGFPCITQHIVDEGRMKLLHTNSGSNMSVSFWQCPFTTPLQWEGTAVGRGVGVIVSGQLSG